MKKTLLLAGVACLFSFGASAEEFRPYVGMDYIFSNANIKKEYDMKKDYNSLAVNAGVKMGEFVSLEAFFQQSGERKKHISDTVSSKTKFHAYGLDMYGYMPIPRCDDTFNLLGSIGLANYNIETKYEGAARGKIDKDRMGYRAGIGMQYNFTENLGARVMGRYTYLGGKALKDLKEVTAGIRYTF